MSEPRSLEARVTRIGEDGKPRAGGVFVLHDDHEAALEEATKAKDEELKAVHEAMGVYEGPPQSPLETAKALVADLAAKDTEIERLMKLLKQRRGLHEDLKGRFDASLAISDAAEAERDTLRALVDEARPWVEERWGCSDVHTDSERILACEDWLTRSKGAKP